MPSNRTIKIGGVWAQGAVDPPATPVQSTTYADSGVTEEEIQAGWPFADIVESAKFNEVMRRLTSLIKLVEEWGVLPWNSSTTYGAKAHVMGSNGEIYYCKVASSTGNDPTTSPTQWGLAFEASGSVSTHAGLASPHSGQTPKTSSGSTTNTVDATGHTHAISAASETVKGAVELATAAETTAGTDNTRAVHPAGLKVELDKKAPLASPVLTGVVTAGQQIVGGFGATSEAGVLDWNDVSNATSGQGPTILRNATNGPPDTAAWFHSFTFEYASKNGGGNLTQFAIPYESGYAMYMRVRRSGFWGAWQPFVLAEAVQTLTNKTLTSPVLTGTPTTPTAAADTNTTQVASTSFVIGQAGPSTPLMAGTAARGSSLKFARDDHRHPTDTTRAPLDSPALTGTPTAPTAANGTYTNQIATTAFAYGGASKSANGYQTLPSGVIIQWGSRSCSFTGAVTNNSVVFPAQFPTACVSVTLTYASTNIATASLNIAATSVTKDGFNISTYANNAFSGTVFWTAEGY